MLQIEVLATNTKSLLVDKTSLALGSRIIRKRVLLNSNSRLYCSNL